MDEFTLDISVPEAQFERHLALSENRRIIFSGPFGSGKTYFLDKFFEKKADKFTVVRLAPVNYSVAQNEDIFELIKFDILFHLLENELFPEDADISRTFVLRHLSLLNPEKGLQGLLEKANKTGSATQGFLKDIEAILKGTQHPYTSSDGLVGLKSLIGFLKKIARDEQGIYEYDAISQLLYYLISEIKTDEKEVLLVIDDLDRIDPEHIFRILNVFAAHFDLNGKENKFGFDRIILVCDVDNIRRVFATRYGQDVDFSGYIDKFYSREIFQFDNRLALRYKVSALLQTVKVNLGSDGKPDINGMFPIARVDHSFHKLTLHIFEALILVNATNLRSVLKSHDLVFELERYHFGRSYNSNQFPIFWILYFIRKILGDGVALRNGIQKCIASKIGLDLYDSSDDRNHLKLGLIIPAVLIPNQMQPNQVTAEPSRYPELGGVRYKIHDENRVSFAIIHQDEGRVDIFPVLLEAIDVFQRMGHLK